MRNMALGAVAAFLLASCSGGEPAAAPPSDAAANQAAATAQPPAPGASAQQGSHPVSPTLLTAEGFGPLRIGMSRAEVVKAMGDDANPEAVGGPDPEACDEFFPARGPKGLLVMIEQGKLTRISLVRESEMKTDRGLGLGATPDQVRAAYGPRGTVTEPHKYAPPPGEYITFWSGPRPVHGPDGTRNPTARGIRYVIEQNRRVAQIHAGEPSIEYVEGCL